MNSTQVWSIHFISKVFFLNFNCQHVPMEMKFLPLSMHFLSPSHPSGAFLNVTWLMSHGQNSLQHRNRTKKNFKSHFLLMDQVAIIFLLTWAFTRSKAWDPEIPQQPEWLSILVQPTFFSKAYSSEKCLACRVLLLHPTGPHYLEKIKRFILVMFWAHPLWKLYFTFCDIPHRTLFISK